ncbi:putative transport protein [Escherichia coli]|uniref:Putative transport protein n=1 Tax=Escherichia coli TaxID=562 RepID=A0A376X3Y1_ECOLX|nr:putative transport protein [Escherichia coli]
MPDFFSFINSVLWGSVMIYLLFAAGCWFTFRTGFVQFRYIRQFGKSLKNSIHPQPGGLTSFQSLLPVLRRAWVAATWPALRWLLPPVDLEPSFGCGLPRLSAWRPRLPNVLWHNFIKNVTSMGSFVADRHGIWRAGWDALDGRSVRPSFCSSPMA